jgi:hypothetical protein
MKIQLPLLQGESPIPSAPNIELDDGTNCIPQHYLSYQHTLESVSNIVAEIEYDPNYILFVDHDHGGIFIQIGIVGLDNYIAAQSQDSKKIVYGRRWRVEANLPSSEIIQTAFLALCKAREHEVRELLKWQTTSSTTTPFSCHHDLPLMAMSADTNTKRLNNSEDSFAQLSKVLGSLYYDGASFCLNTITLIDSNNSVLSIKVQAGVHSKLPEITQSPTICLLVDNLEQDTVLYALMDRLLALSNSHVEEHFSFKGYRRFSRSNSIEKIATLSAKTRRKEILNEKLDFKQLLTHSNYETDTTRVPSIRHGKLGGKIQTQLSRLNVGAGILPRIN